MKRLKEIKRRRCRKCHRGYYLQEGKHYPLDHYNFCPDCLYEIKNPELIFCDPDLPPLSQIPSNDFKGQVDNSILLENLIKNAELSKREIKVLHYRKDGWTFREIEGRFKFGKTHAHRIFWEAIEKIRIRNGIVWQR